MHPIIAIAQGIGTDAHTAKWTAREYVDFVIAEIPPGDAADEVTRTITADPDAARQFADMMDREMPRR